MRCPSPIEMLAFPLEQAFQLPFLGSLAQPKPRTCPNTAPNARDEMQGQKL